MAQTNFNWFWHHGDKLTLTSKGIVWCFAGVFVENGIVAELGQPFKLNDKIMGICTDYPIEWKRWEG